MGAARLAATTEPAIVEVLHPRGAGRAILRLAIVAEPGVAVSLRCAARAAAIPDASLLEERLRGHVVRPGRR